MQFKSGDRLDIVEGDIVRINGNSVHIVTKVHYKWDTSNHTFPIAYGAVAYTIKCDQYGYDDGMKVGQVCSLYIEEFLRRAEENSIEVLHRVYTDTVKP